MLCTILEIKFATYHHKIKRVKSVIEGRRKYASTWEGISLCVRFVNH